MMRRRMCKRPLFSFEEIPPERAKIRGTRNRQAVRPGTKSRFLHRVLPAPRKNACWELPKPFSNCIRWMQAARSFGTLPFSYKQKTRQRPTQNRPLACFVYRLCCRSGCGVSSAKNRSIFFCARKSRCISSLALRYSG